MENEKNKSGKGLESKIGNEDRQLYVLSARGVKGFSQNTGLNPRAIDSEFSQRIEL